MSLHFIAFKCICMIFGQGNLASYGQPLKTTTGSPSRTKSAGGRSTTLYHQTLTRPLVAAAVTVPVYPELALLTTNMPVVKVDHPLLNFCSQSQAMMISGQGNLIYSCLLLWN